MITTDTMPVKESTDAELVSRTLAGDRDAFNRIVGRYQILVCSLAYTRLGNLGQSEDVAQETFITAWKHLRLLREPEKLRAWLCGIARNRLRKHLHRETREPAHQAGSLDDVHDTPDSTALPSDQAIGREEQAILWRSLEKIPELYRESLILYYRENQSISQVAQALDLTEDTVKQRLSRGRKLLQEEVQVFVERALGRTAPGENFSSAVLAALPAGPAAAAGLGAVVKGAAVVKTGLLGASVVALAPFIGVLAGLFSQWSVIHATSTGRERYLKMLQMTAFFILIPGLSVGGEYAVSYLGGHYGWSVLVYYLARTGFWWCFAAGLGAWLVLQLRKVQALHVCRPVTAQGSLSGAMMTPGKRALVIIGLHLTKFAWLISIAYGSQDPATAVILTGLMVALGVWNFLDVRAADGAGEARMVITRMAVYGVIVLLVFNLRLNVWMANDRGVSLDQIHLLYSPWILPSLTLALTGWIALVWIMTKPKRDGFSGAQVKAA